MENQDNSTNQLLDEGTELLQPASDSTETQQKVETVESSSSQNVDNVDMVEKSQLSDNNDKETRAANNESIENSTSAKNPNSFTLVSELADFSSPRKHWENISNSASSSATVSTSSSDCMLSPSTMINQLDTSNEANPRKNSPVPVSPMANIYLEVLETSSIEHLSSLQNARSQSDSLNNPNEHTEVNQIESNRPWGGRSQKISPQKSIKNHHHDRLQKNGKIEFCMDKWYKEMKDQILTEVSKVHSLREQQKKLVEEKEKQSGEIKRLRSEIEFHKESIKIHEKNLSKKDEEIANLSKILEKQREKNDLQRRMIEWKVSQLENSKETFTLKLAENYYNHRMKQKFFYTWRYSMLEVQKSKIEKACKKKAEEICLDIATRYEAKIKKMEEDRLKIEDELRLSRLENEKYRIELAKSEENMRKALMRGVCALNLEAMSIFNENIAHPIAPTGPVTDRPLYHPNPDSVTRSLPRKLTNSRNNMTTREREKDLLARKVRQYCEVKFDAESKTKTGIEPDISTEAVVAAAVKAATETKIKLLNDNAIHGPRLSDNFRPTETADKDPKTQSTNKIFAELVEHSINLPSKPKSFNVRSKIDSFPNTSKSDRIINMTGSRPGSSQGTGKTVNHFQQRVIIEKHKPSFSQSNIEEVKSGNESRFTTPLSSFK